MIIIGVLITAAAECGQMILGDGAKSEMESV